MAAHSWVSAHLFYQGDMDDLLVRLVRPLVADLAAEGLADACFYLRYWEGGPHLRLRLRAASVGALPGLRDLAATRCTQYLRTRPSPDVLGPSEYAVLATELARRERRTSYERTLRTNNTMAFVAYRPETWRYGTGPSLRAVERHFAASSRAALAALPLGHREAVGYAVILLAWLVSPPAANAAMRHDGADTEQASAVKARWDRHRDRLLQDAQRLRTLVERPGRGLLAEWAAAVRRLRGELDQNLDLPGDRARNVSTVLDICAHLMCNRLGVPLTAEPPLRRMAALTMAALYDNEVNRELA